MTAIPEHAHVSYQYQYRRCGKCMACKQGPGHGPYFYGYWREPGKRPQSKNMGKVLKVEIVRAYFSQVYRVPAEEMPTRWQDFKRSTLGQDIADESLTQEQLRMISLACKEHCQKREKAASSGTTTIPERQAAVA